MKKNDFRQLLQLWVRDLSEIYVWCSKQTISTLCKEIYPQVQTMWFEHRDVFPNKGIYKMVRRLLVKNIARVGSMQPYCWLDLPVELCKEILHKADQGWISIDKELPASFREYLIGEATQIGYPKRRTESLCYVDEHLKVVFNRSEAVGIVNLLPKTNMQVEIFFFNPLENNDVSKSKAKKIIEKWGDKHYSEFHAYFPTFATCSIANKFLSLLSPKIHDCFVDIAYGKYETFILNREAKILPMNDNTKASKLYVSVYMKLSEFHKLNPQVLFPRMYVTSM